MEDLVEVLVDSSALSRDVFSLIAVVMDVLCWTVVSKPGGRFVVGWAGIGCPV